LTKVAQYASRAEAITYRGYNLSVKTSVLSTRGEVGAAEGSIYTLFRSIVLPGKNRKGQKTPFKQTLIFMETKIFFLTQEMVKF
jgi:hypothetical protein